VSLVVNLKTARLLGITFPLALLGRADDVPPLAGCSEKLISRRATRLNALLLRFRDAEWSHGKAPGTRGARGLRCGAIAQREWLCLDERDRPRASQRHRNTSGAMGRLNRDQRHLFYCFNVEEVVPDFTFDIC
jgi:hypothetical protein